VYTTCLFCHADLGRNEALEAFPVGRRLAYDAEKGRLWVVCRRCERWNLTPQEERWEAIEHAERLYRGTRPRASTDNIGLARLRDATELVRVGRPLRPEFAAWRYGDQFGRRRRRRVVAGAAGATALLALVVAGPVTGLFGFSTVHALYNATDLARHHRRNRRGIVVDPAPRGHGLRVSVADAEGTRLVPDDGGGFAIVIPVAQPRWYDVWTSHGVAARPNVRLAGERGLTAASRLLPHVNRGGGDPVEVRNAVGVLDDAGSAQALFTRVAATGRQGSRADANRDRADAAGPALSTLPPRVRLALEMAVHEEQERRALDGELRELEDAWRRAEEIAAIADDLLLPERLAQKLDQLKGRSSARAGAASSPASDNGGATSS
jgi:hypothetical protein